MKPMPRPHARSTASCFLALLIPATEAVAHHSSEPPSRPRSGATREACPADEAYARRLVVHGIEILATESVDAEYLYIAARVYEHMTSRSDPYDLRAAHRQSGFRILLITEDDRFSDLPEYAGQGDEIDRAGGLGGCIGEFFIGVRVGSPHVLVHELGHGIYHSGIQYLETGGADDEEAWYEERAGIVHGLSIEEAIEEYGEEEIHEVLLAEEGTFSADLAAAWHHADAEGLWRDEYAGTEPNEYWAEGVALWFRAWPLEGEDPREMLLERDPMLHALCARIFPDTDWDPSQACVDGPDGVPFEEGGDDFDEHDPDAALLGGAVMRTATGEAPHDLYAVTDVVRTEDLGPLSKKLTSCGIMLGAGDDIDDDFLRLVGKTLAEVFGAGEGIDQQRQRNVLRHLYAYRTLLPVPKSEREFERLFHRNPEAMDRLRRQNSICDIIMSGVPHGQVMEVVEHLLHSITDVGLHYEYPHEWGLSRDSELYRAMRKSIEHGYYNVQSYEDMRDDAPPEVYLRVLLQEFAYWFISTAWDLQQDYGPTEEEWTLRTPAALKNKLPEFYAVYERTAAKVLTAPSRTTLQKIGPTRDN